MTSLPEPPLGWIYVLLMRLDFVIFRSLRLPRADSDDISNRRFRVGDAAVPLQDGPGSERSPSLW